MVHVAAAEQPTIRTYGNWRRPRSAGLGKLGMIGTGLLIFGMIVTVIVLATAGVIAAAIVVLVFGAVLALLSIHDRHNRTPLQRGWARLSWRMARSRGTHLYRSGPLGRIPYGRFQLPGLAARSELSEGRDSWDRPFALLYTRTTADYTVVFSTDPDGASLVDQLDVDRWVAHWGAWLAQLGDEPGVTAAQVVIETAPDTGARLQREVHGRIDPQAPAVAQSMLREVVATYPAGSATVRACVAITFNAAPRPGARRRKPDEMARDLASRLPGLGEGLQATGAGPARPMSAQELCEFVRVAYEPRVAKIIDEAYAAGDVPELSWSDVGPAAAETRWASYRHDNAVSVTWSMTEAPRGAVQSNILERLLAPNATIARKRVTLLYHVMDAATAARTVEADRNVADFRATSSNTPSARVARDQKAAAAAAEEEARGAGLVSFGMLVTATTLNADELADVTATIDNLSATARLALRPVYGAQDSAFAAALPLGVVVARHLRVPAEVRRAL